MLSQDNESKIIAEFFGSHVGTFLDCGASGGVSLSNTFELGLKGWHGLFVEASPTHFANLVANYIHRGGFTFINAALWHERKMMKFNYNPYFYSSLIHKDEPGLFVAQYWVPTVTATDLSAIEPSVDFISLDIEGADIHVFPSLAEAYPNCRLWCEEHANNDTLKVQWQRLFTEHKLRIIATTPENYIVAR